MIAHLHERERWGRPVLRTAILHRVGRLVVPLFACAMWSSAASATCVWTDLIHSQTRAAAINRTTPRVHFVQDTGPGCPAAGAACQSRAYVTTGDIVLAGNTRNGYTCTGFQGPRGSGTIGWLPSAGLNMLPAAAQIPADWAGHWYAPEQDIVIKAAPGGMLSVKGDATWGMSAWRAEHGSVHVGTLNGISRPVGGVLSFTEGEGRTLPYTGGDEFSCKVRMIRRGPYLLVRDNDNCGGANVSFSGFYARKP
ncbi:hypothetical protein C8J47_1105 [Sphingomonas sp. PP-F2F-G114-C0414]|nr:hypothetical protein C8J47_1105 [Sphingomonas sp. PP-F2F-G114-C0414]